MNIIDILLATNCISSYFHIQSFEEIKKINFNLPEKYDLFHENQQSVIKRNNKKINDMKKRFPTKTQYQNYCREK